MNEILFEIRPVGNSVKVCAIHEATGLEAVVIVPRTVKMDMAKKQAANKLKYLIKKQNEETSEKDEGILV